MTRGTSTESRLETSEANDGLDTQEATASTSGTPKEGLEKYSERDPLKAVFMHLPSIEEHEAIVGEPSG